MICSRHITVSTTFSGWTPPYKDVGSILLLICTGATSADANRRKAGTSGAAGDTAFLYPSRYGTGSNAFTIISSAATMYVGVAAVRYGSEYVSGSSSVSVTSAATSSFYATCKNVSGLDYRLVSRDYMGDVKSTDHRPYEIKNIMCNYLGRDLSEDRYASVSAATYNSYGIILRSGSTSASYSSTSAKLFPFKDICFGDSWVYSGGSSSIRVYSGTTYAVNALNSFVISVISNVSYSVNIDVKIKWGGGGDGYLFSGSGTANPNMHSSIIANVNSSTPNAVTTGLSCSVMFSRSSVTDVPAFTINFNGNTESGSIPPQIQWTATNSYSLTSDVNSFSVSIEIG